MRQVGIGLPILGLPILGLPILGLVVLALAGSTGAGEVVFGNGSRLEAELLNEMLVVSTGSDLLEVAAGQIEVLTRDEIRFRDGRVLRGTVVGEQLRLRTALGEIAVKTAEIQMFRASREAPASPGPRTPSVDDAGAPAPQGETGAPGVTATPGAAGGSGARPDPPAMSPRAPSARRFEVVAGSSALYRDALTTARPVGRVTRGEQVVYVDFIDRRFRLFNTLVFDGGHWIKVRAATGAEGWIPAEHLQEVR